jgi:DeoR family transcriptional regulator of aga operon/DeoR family fructose operon transcriptional repressor
MGVIGLTVQEGLTKHDIEALPIRQKMVEISRQLICVADSSKLGVTGLVSVCPIDRLDVLITDNGIPPDVKRTLEGLGITVIVV